MTEEWRDVKGYEGCYEVSSFGVIRSVDRWREPFGYPQLVRGQIMRLYQWRGYRTIYLRKPGEKKKKCFVHRLVADAFIPNPEGKAFVNHLDRNRANCRLDNLQWATPQENSDHWVEDDRRRTSEPAPFVSAIMEADVSGIPF